VPSNIADTRRTRLTGITPMLTATILCALLAVLVATDADGNPPSSD